MDNRTRYNSRKRTNSVPELELEDRERLECICTLKRSSRKMETDIEEQPKIRENQPVFKEDPPNPEFMKALMEMGISQANAKQAIRKTNNSSLEAAVSCALELNDDSEEEWVDIDERFKMVFVVNSSLNMGIGKTAAQVAHAAVDLYKICLMDKAEECVKLACWQDSGEKKIVVSCNDENELFDLAKKAVDLKIPHYIVRDAGLTEIPEDSVTVLGLFGTEEEVDKVTKHLRLL